MAYPQMTSGYMSRPRITHPASRTPSKGSSRRAVITGAGLQSRLMHSAITFRCSTLIRLSPRSRGLEFLPHFTIKHETRRPQRPRCNGTEPFQPTTAADPNAPDSKSTIAVSWLQNVLTDDSPTLWTNDMKI